MVAMFSAFLVTILFLLLLLLFLFVRFVIGANFQYQFQPSIASTSIVTFLSMTMVFLMLVLPHFTPKIGEEL